MFISDDALQERLKSPTNLINRTPVPSARRVIVDKVERQEINTELPTAEGDVTVITPLHNGGRRPGDKNIPDGLRAIIGAVARVDTLENTAEAFGISTHHAHELKHGKMSNAQGQDDKLVKDINDKLETPHDIALRKLTESLLAVDINKVDKNKPKDAVMVASALSRIVEQTSPIKRDDDEDKGARLVIYAPTIRQENSYGTVNVTRQEPANA
jgi:hypothetical protein